MTTTHIAQMPDHGQPRLHDALLVPIGQDEAGNRHFVPLSHLLIAGEADTGKTDYMRSAVDHLLASNSPSRVRLLRVDPLNWLGRYSDAPHAGLDNNPATVQTATQLCQVLEQMGVLRAVLRQRQKSCLLHKGALWTSGHILYLFNNYERLFAQTDLRVTRDFHAELSMLLTCGPRVGIHVWLCTTPDLQRLRHVVDRTDVRVVFRCADAGRSYNVLGQPTAAMLDGQPDRALYYDEGRIVSVQVGEAQPLSG